MHVLNICEIQDYCSKLEIRFIYFVYEVIKKVHLYSRINKNDVNSEWKIIYWEQRFFGMEVVIIKYILWK